MWNDPLITPKPEKRPPAPKAPPKKAAKKPKRAKPKGPSNTKLVKELATLKEQYKAQAVQLNRLTEIVAGIQVGKFNSPE